MQNYTGAEIFDLETFILYKNYNNKCNACKIKISYFTEIDMNVFTRITKVVCSSILIRAFEL